MSHKLNAKWYVVPQPWDDSACLVIEGHEDPNAGVLICNTAHCEWLIDDEEYDLPEWQANAELIAAAPDLLRACVAAYNVYIKDRAIPLTKQPTARYIEKALIAAGYLEKEETVTI